MQTFLSVQMSRRTAKEHPGKSERLCSFVFICIFTFNDLKMGLQVDHCLNAAGRTACPDYAESYASGDVSGRLPMLNNSTDRG
jgi:hypothetical protein